MCVVALAWQAHPDWPLILIGNRDEFHARPSAALAVWDDGSDIIAGRDWQAGGTWLGVHPASGRIVVVTNVRGSLPDPAKESRGALVIDMLRGDGRFADPQVEQLDGFNAFNLISIDARRAQLFTNRPSPAIQPLQPGVHALANEPALTPCPRAARLGEAVAVWLAGQAGDPASLLDVLRTDDPPALFLDGEIYGTRCSTVAAVNADGKAMIIERRFAASGRAAGETKLDFRWPMLGHKLITGAFEV